MATAFRLKLEMFETTNRPLPGVPDGTFRDAFIEQLVESERRVQWVGVVGGRPIDPRRRDPHSDLFCPIRAATLHSRAGEHDEACWLVFLSTHFGKNRRTGWRLMAHFYGGMGRVWDWRCASTDVVGLCEAVERNLASLSRAGGFGNHRKYETVAKAAQLQRVVSSYVTWVGPDQSHAALFDRVLTREGGDEERAFRALYESMGGVHRFGRIGRFDYLSMIYKLKLAQIRPDALYLVGATGPWQGARMLFGQRQASGVGRSGVDRWCTELANTLGVDTNVLEDALCNWQKSPHRFAPFRG